MRWEVLGGVVVGREERVWEKMELCEFNGVLEGIGVDEGVD